MTLIVKSVCFSQLSMHAVCMQMTRMVPPPPHFEPGKPWLGCSGFFFFSQQVVRQLLVCSEWFLHHIYTRHNRYHSCCITPQQGCLYWIRQSHCCKSFVLCVSVCVGVVWWLQGVLGMNNNNSNASFSKHYLCSSVSIDVSQLQLLHYIPMHIPLLLCFCIYNFTFKTFVS